MTLRNLQREPEGKAGVVNGRFSVTTDWTKGFVSLVIYFLGVLALSAAPMRHGDGMVLLGELNCTACHSSSEVQSSWISPKAAPQLKDVGTRASAEWLRHYLASPQETMPGMTMPDALHGMKLDDRAAAAEAITHYLLSLSSGNFMRVLPDRAAVSRGESLFHRVGCVACHAPQGKDAKSVGSVPLPVMEEKWAFDGLRQFLIDPLASRPSGRMPSMGLTAGESADIAHYLLRETKVPAAVEVAQYRGRIHSLEDLDTGELAKTGPAERFSLKAMGNNRGYALRFTGWMRMEKAGEYTFFLEAAGASRLAIDHEWLLGQESWETESVEGNSKITLDPGWHEVTVDYVQRGSKVPALKVDWAGPGVAREEIPTARLQSRKETMEVQPHFVVDDAKAAKGRTLYEQLRCAACHEPAQPSLPELLLSKLQPLRGCLAEKPTAKSPDYHFDDQTREALTAALKALNQTGLPSPTPQQRISHTLMSFNCTACHVRDGVGGVSPDRDAFFTSNGEDLGDEGRIPPRLDGVGDRLKPSWLRNVLMQGGSVRPYMNTRMPQFGSANVANLPELLVTVDRQAKPLALAGDPTDAQREAGRKLVGTDGLSCIACHRFNRQPAQALQVLDLISTTERLNEDWFRRFLLDPNLFHPGTRMPAFWPDGISPLPELLGGNTDRQHAAIWTYLKDGAQAKFPEGLSRQNMELIVGGEPVLYRGKLWEAGFRGVAVGYPGQLNSAFDAEEMRLALLWQGRFLNAAPHWGVQGMGQIHPLGSNVVVFPHGAPLAVLGDRNQPWPTEPSKAAGMKFRGYQIDPLKRPTLLYSFHAMGVEDFLTPSQSAEKAGLRRTLKFASGPPENLYLRLARGKLSPVSPNVWRLDGVLTLKVSGSAEAFVRGKGEQQELLVPVQFGSGEHQLEVEYVW